MLRQAAVTIRAEQDIEEDLGHITMREYDAWLAVADWLDECAPDFGQGYGHSRRPRTHRRPRLPRRAPHLAPASRRCDAGRAAIGTEPVVAPQVQRETPPGIADGAREQNL